MCASLIEIGSKTAEKNSAQTNRQTDRHYENNGHLAVNQQLVIGSRIYMSFRLVPKSVTLNEFERRNVCYIALFQRIFVYGVAVKQLLGLPRF